MFDWFKSRKPYEYLSAVALLLAVVDLLGLEVTWVTVILVAIAMAPWLFSFDRIHKYV